MCGIAGIFGKETKKGAKAFNPTILKLLMLSQDSRGRDNCGLYYKAIQEDEEGKKIRTNAIDWGWEGDNNGNSKTFRLFLGNRDLLPFSAPYKVIAHSRKGSVGSASRDNSHPFKCGNIVGVHNGTVRLWKEFMDYLSVDISDIDTDSEALFKAISEGKTEEVLSQHPGAATLVWTDIETDLSYVWVSGTKSTYSTMINQDRDFHMWPTEAGLYFSSELDPLRTCRLVVPEGFELARPYEVQANTLITIKGDKIIEQKEIKRKPFTNTSTSGNAAGKKGNQTKTKVTPLKTTNKSGTTSSTTGASTQTSSTQSNSENSKENSTKDLGKNSANKLFGGGKDYRSFGDQKLTGLEEESKDTPYFRIAIRNGLYFRGHLPLHSMVSSSVPPVLRHTDEFKQLGYWIEARYFTTEDGLLYWYSPLTDMYTCADYNKPSLSKKDGDELLTEVFFFNGVLIKNEKSLIEMLTLYNEALKDMKNISTNTKISPKLVARFALSPVWCGLSNPSDDIHGFYAHGLANYKIAKDIKTNLMTGYFRYPFTNTVYKFEKGIPTEYIKWSDEMFSVDTDGVETDEELLLKFQDFRSNFWTGKMSSWAYKAHGLKNNTFSVGCAECGEVHKLDIKDLLRVPACNGCGNPIVIQDEKYFPKTVQPAKT
jgi:hypothetical protein